MKWTLISVLTIGALLWGPSVQASEVAHGPTARHSHGYTPLQRAIATAIAQLAEAYYAQTTAPLPVNPETIAMVMHSLDATPADAAFIYDRMYAHSLNNADIHQIDGVLDQIHQHIQTPSASSVLSEKGKALRNKSFGRPNGTEFPPCPTSDFRRQPS